ncbi:AraC family transcriptional regulator (plasmid) [Adhaeribacter swui]|uniref:AraC family transcriptional regulator n=1 Tax=Adhaeribacter swui TaxID=2086471 RepID=A0A7G7G292_9BACT|nr:helix-turn-helix domain-containing protein [Adhaeribacter swui]QNF31276.1 AraC family transcriptional regulator [Adhaeribacter swui]
MEPLAPDNKVTLHIKNMVCPRCIRIIREQFARLEIPVLDVQLGLVELTRPLQATEKEKVLIVLEDYGFELLVDKKLKLVEQIKTCIIDLIHHKSEKITTTYSTYLSQAIGKDYSTLSHVFSSVENMTIERFIILQKIEYIKAQLDYEELSLGEIASRLHYSSLSHLSKQFKTITGYTPSEYKKQAIRDRLPLDRLKKADT